MDVIVLYPLLVVLTGICVSSLPLSPAYLADSNVRLPGRSLLKPWTTCTEKLFGFAGIKVPLCKTIWQYSLTKPPLVTCYIGKVDAKTADRLKQAYSGILMNKQQSPPRGRGHDNDMCCPTRRTLEQAPSRMENSLGVSRDIAHIPSISLYQYYHAGRCVDSSEHTHCPGICLQKMSVVYLMVFREDLPMGMSFEPFDVPSYCSCQNIGRQPGRKKADKESSTTVKPAEKPTRIVHERIKPNLTISPGPIRVHYGKVVSRTVLERALRKSAGVETRAQQTPAYSTTTPSLASKTTTQNDTVTAPDVTATFDPAEESNLTTTVTTT